MNTLKSNLLGKFLVVLAVLFALMALAACSASTTTNASSATATTAANSAAPMITVPSPTAAASTSPTSTTTSAAPAPATSGQAVTINLVSQNMAFDQSTITVPAGANVTMNYNNKDSIPHNFALYTDQSAATVIFKGKIISNSNIAYTFTAPSTPGTYFFRCDVHPTTMTGSFIVK